MSMGSQYQTRPWGSQYQHVDIVAPWLNLKLKQNLTIDIVKTWSIDIVAIT